MILSEMIYECIRCGARPPLSKIEELGFKCPECGFKGFKKIRPPVVKRIKAI